MNRFFRLNSGSGIEASQPRGDRAAVGPRRVTQGRLLRLRMRAIGDASKIIQAWREVCGVELSIDRVQQHLTSLELWHNQKKNGKKILTNGGNDGKETKS